MKVVYYAVIVMAVISGAVTIYAEPSKASLLVWLFVVILSQIQLLLTK